MEKETVVVILSGGMDSTVLTYLLAENNDAITVSFDYGQRHKKELDYAAETAARLNIPNIVVEMDFMSKLLHDSVLTDFDREVPDGHYAEETMKATVVPNRNMIMLSIATGIAVAEGANYVATAVHAGDHFIYPDCRPEFIRAVNEAAILATDGFAKPQFAIMAPFVGLTKQEIAKLGSELEVPFQWTWSCYKGGAIHCGRCGTCVERKEAFRIAEVRDPTMYEDPDFEVVAYRGVEDQAS